MKYSDFFGFHLKDVEEVLKHKGIVYEIREAFDSKKTKLGEDVRVINITEGDKILIYVAYF